MLGRSRAAMQRLRRVPRSTSPRTAARKRDRATPLDMVGKGPLLAAPGLTFGVVVIVRDEARHLPEWLAYHHALGVEHVFLYDNGSHDAIDEVLEPWINHGLVTLVRWPLPGGQLDAYAHALRFYGPSVEWLGFFDADEFVVPLVDDDIPTLLARWPEAADVRVPRVDFGFSGHRTPAPGLTIEAYTGVADVFGRDPAKLPRVKTIARSRGVAAVGIHTATVPDVATSVYGQPSPRQTIGSAACAGLVQLNHYYTRSYEEFEAKRVRGSATGRIDRPAVPFDLPTLRVDTSAQRFAGRTRATLELMGSLARSPYHYGSRLALAQFPRFNDLGLFAEFAVDNVVAEEPAPRREPRLRLENLYAGTGFVGRLPEPDAGAADAHRPRRGDLSTSPHLAPLLERTRGRLEAGWASQPDLPSATLRIGSLEPTEDGWRLVGDGGRAEVAFNLEPHGQRRCHALGFVIRSGAPVALRAGLEDEEDASSVPVDVTLSAPGTYAGLVELDPRPRLPGRVILHLETEATLIVHDLFVLSYG